MIITDGTGTCNAARVTSNNRLDTISTSLSAQARESAERGKSFQVSGTATPVVGSAPVLWLTNTSAESMIITFIRMASSGIISDTEANYFSIVKNPTYNSGGVAVDPINMNYSSNVDAEATAYSGSTPLVLGSTSVEIDRNYKVNDMLSYDKQGSVVLQKGNSIGIVYTDTATAGEVYARISFYYSEAV